MDEGRKRVPLIAASPPAGKLAQLKGAPGSTLMNKCPAIRRPRAVYCLGHSLPSPCNLLPEFASNKV